MKQIANLLFEIRMLKDINRSGYSFLGSGRESIADHCFTTAFICFTMARLDPEVDSGRLVAMALVHDFGEARTGDFNYVQKKYSETNEERAISHLIRNIPFGDDIRSLIDEFNRGETKEARLANDADQISFVLELKKLKDIGSKPPEKWLPIVGERVKTRLGKQILEGILETRWDEWWMNDYSE
ncbi:HD domain-containing protein [Desulfospira joergensenii]|uniref:HD domain-containing protein n=1 Tax=Desulfospira joergensenii TaxID=53329 RepID=UPI0003B37EA0|nr:HD domain-containing protein [Desulfospira joergensenii]